VKSRNTDKRFNVLGVGVSDTTIQNAVTTILNWIENGEKHYVCVTGVHGVMECQKDPALKKIHNSSGMTVPDGMPLVWIGHLLGFKSISRVYGPDLMVEVCKKSNEYG